MVLARCRCDSLVVCLLCVSAGLAVPAAAQFGPGPGQFEAEITVTATGAEEPTDEVPVPVDVVSRDEMDDAQSATVAEVLRRLPGVVVAAAGDDGKVTSVFTRGTESDHTLVMLDGIRLNSPYFGGYDWSLLPTAGLDRVEVARGPFSALWGSDAVGGVVNLIPGRAGAGLDGSLLAEGGSDSWRRLEGAVAWGDHGFDLYASGFTRSGEGELDASDFELEQVLVDAGVELPAGGRLAVVAQDLSAETGIPFVTPGVPSPNRRQWSDQRLVAMPVELRPADGWALGGSVSWVERDLIFSDPDDHFGLTASETVAVTTLARLQSRHELGRHQLTWGGEWKLDEVDDETVWGVNLDGETTRTAAAFVQDVWRPWERLRMVVGARWDSTESWGDQLSPRLALGWRLSRGLALEVAYGEAFRQPSVGELYYPVLGNPGLEPETSRSAEVGVTWAPESGSLEGRLGVFRTDLDNLIEYDYANATFGNIREAEIVGAEVGLQVPLGGAFVGEATATWLDTDDGSGETLLRRPGLAGAVAVRGPLTRWLRGDLALVWVGERDDVDPITYARATNGSRLTTDLALAARVWRELEVTVRATNLADESYDEVLGYPAPGRRLYAGLRLAVE